MRTSKSKLIEHILQKFSGNKEDALAAENLLETTITEESPLTEEALQQLEQNNEKRKPVKAIFYIAFWIISLFILSKALNPYFKRALDEFHDSSASHKTFPEYIAKILSPNIDEYNFTPEEKFKLFGDPEQSSWSLRFKAKHEAFPDNPAYYQQYIDALISEGNKLPENYYKTIEEIDPDNAWFLYLSAEKKGAGAVEQDPHTEKYSIINKSNYVECLALIEKAVQMPKCIDYRKQNLQELVEILPHETFGDYTFSALHYISSTFQAATTNFSTSSVISCRLEELANSGSIDAYRKQLQTAETYLKVINDRDTYTLIDETHSVITTAKLINPIVNTSKILQLEKEHSHYEAIQINLEKITDLRKAPKTFEIDGQPYSTKTGVLSSVVLTGFDKWATNLNPLQALDFTPERLQDHEATSMSSSYLSWFLFIIFACVIWIYRKTQPKPVNRSAKEILPIFQKSDFLWIFSLGVFLPTLSILILNRYTLLGLREWSSFSPLGASFLLPGLHFLSIVYLVLFSSYLTIRWRSSKRIPITSKGRLRKWLAIAGITLTISAIFITSLLLPRDHSSEAHITYLSIASIYSAPLLIIIVILLSLLANKPLRRLQSLITAHMMIPSICGAALIMILLSIVFGKAADYQFQQDTIYKFQKDKPAINKIELIAATESRQAMRKILGYE